MASLIYRSTPTLNLHKLTYLEDEFLFQYVLYITTKYFAPGMANVEDRANHAPESREVYAPEDFGCIDLYNDNQI